MPQMLWPGWTVRLLPPAGFATDAFRAGTAAAVLLPGSPSRGTRDAAELLRPDHRVGVARVLERLAAEGHEGVLAALCALADYLDTHGAPIDYARRRALVSSDLLPAEVWHDLCARVAASPGGPRRLRDARRHLYQRITGNDLRHAAAPLTLPSRDRAVYMNLPLELPEALHRALDDYAAAYLAGKGVGEPLVWEPPAGCLGGLDLPGADPADLDVGLLHHLLRDGGLSPGEAAARLGTSIEHVRLALEQAPLPTRPPSPRSIPGAAERKRQARGVLTPAFLGAARAAGKGIRTISGETGFSRGIVADLVDEAGLATGPGWRPARHVDPDWLREQYLTRRRTLRDIAAELGISATHLGRHATSLGIPLRQGGAGHAAALARPDPALPRVIRQALTGEGTWERLRRFQAAMRHPTLGHAADALGLELSVLASQFSRLERDIGAELYIRAVRCHPMRLTRRGRALLAALDGLAPPSAGAAESGRMQVLACG